MRVAFPRTSTATRWIRTHSSGSSRSRTRREAVTPRVGVVGPGALGTALAGVLRSGGLEVVVRGRGERGAGGRPLDLVLLCTKSHDVEGALETAAPLVGPETLVATLQNGIGSFERVLARFGPERAVAGATTEAACRDERGELRHTARGRTRLAPAGPLALQRLERCVPALRRAGLDVEIAPDPVALVWSKLIVAAAILPVTALLGLPNGAIAGPGPAAQLAAQAAREAARVAVVSGTMESTPAHAACERVREVASRTANNRSSMLCDLEAGRRTEIDAISGEVARRAQALGLEAWCNWTLWQLVRARERR
ncbi:MAG: 2-dehydropantoate 2-reductase [Planctomycetota bacterium]|nr:MAG: 2-dehydropantoate 2-reductase [Planctomycetota bacterium]